MKTPAWLRSGLKYFSSSISNKIIIPYALLTAILAMFGVFVVTQLVAGSFEARLKNQLLEAGQVVSDEVVARERLRLEVERTVANTIGVPESLVNRDFEQLNEFISPIIANSMDIDSIVLVDTQGKEVLRLHRETPSASAAMNTRLDSGADYAHWMAVRNVLADPQGEIKDTQFATDQNGNQLTYTVGPVQTREGIVGAALVGTYLKREVEILHSLALADLTLFDDSARVTVTTLPLGQAEAEEIFNIFTPARYRQVLRENKVTLLDEVEGPQDIQTRSQHYRLAYAPFLLRGRVFGVYAVALPTDFVTETNNNSRNRLVLIFTVGVGAVFFIGYLVSRRIIQPITHLVRTARAIAAGDLSRRTGLELNDEIGVLAKTFDQMTAELQLLIKIQEEEASKLNAILSSIADGVVVLDQTGDIILKNPAAEEILEIMGDHFSLAMLQQSGGEVEPITENDTSAHLLTALTGLEFREKRRLTIGQRVLDALSAPVKTPDGGLLGLVVVLRDITREFEAEKLKDDFITSVSHELRTPLTAIKGYNDLLKMTVAGKLNENQIRFFDSIDDNVRDLLNIIQQMLDLSQIDADELGIDQEPLDLTELIEAEAAKWVSKMAEKEISLDTNLPDGPVWVEGDWSRLSQVIDNLLDNAYNYSLQGANVEILLNQDNSRGQIDVKDSGVGILEKDQPYIFTRFFRAIHDERTYDVSGAGLALYICKAIIEAHDGEIWFKSKPYQGSTFSFAFPTVDNPDKPADIEQDSIEFVQTESRSGTFR